MPVGSVARKKRYQNLDPPQPERCESVSRSRGGGGGAAAAIAAAARRQRRHPAFIAGPGLLSTPPCRFGPARDAGWLGPANMAHMLHLARVQLDTPFCSVFRFSHSCSVRTWVCMRLCHHKSMCLHCGLCGLQHVGACVHAGLDMCVRSLGRPWLHLCRSRALVDRQSRTFQQPWPCQRDLHANGMRMAARREVR